MENLSRKELIEIMNYCSSCEGLGDSSFVAGHAAAIHNIVFYLRDRINNIESLRHNYKLLKDIDFCKQGAVFNPIEVGNRIVYYNPSSEGIYVNEDHVINNTELFEKVIN